MHQVQGQIMFSPIGDRSAIKILCLGNNTEDTDVRARHVAQSQNLPCHGLLSELETKLTEDSYAKHGVYHTSIYDIEFGRLVDLANSFDEVWMLDQPIQDWSHPDAFLRTIKVLDTTSSKQVFLDPAYKSNIDYFSNLVRTNKSFCIFPFIELLVNNYHTTVCCRSSTPISPISGLDFKKDKNYRDIRNKMLMGEMIPDHCAVCYKLEENGLPSARITETVEWANRANFSSIEDLDSISKPLYYEVRASNKCNLQCRMCSPKCSHLIEEEYKRIGLISQSQITQTIHTSGFEIIDFDNLHKLYVAGGEPLVMAEFYEFVEKCINSNCTDFEFVINTNGTKLSQKFLNQAKKFSNLQFIFSIDGYNDINHYIRWPSVWDDIVTNWRYLVDAGHKVMINTTLSIYNISNLHLLYQFIDENFPGTLAHCQLVGRNDMLSPWLFPEPALALESLNQILVTQCCQNNLLFRDSIKGYIEILKKGRATNKEFLKKFFDFNDLLDNSRQIKLIDYIPKLESYRNN